MAGEALIQGTQASLLRRRAAPMADLLDIMPPTCNRSEAPPPAIAIPQGMPRTMPDHEADDAPMKTAQDRRAPIASGAAATRYATALLHVLTATGYGLWMVLGAALALGVYSDGRGDVLAPLGIGLVFVSVGLVAACMRLAFAADWHGWNPMRTALPSREGMIAMANYLPMLAVAGLARGDNEFWATRLAGAALLLCSLATLIYTARGAARRLSVRDPTLAMLPVGRTIAALFAGSLWFWLCVSLQSDDGGEPPDVSLWRLVLLAVALALGIVEGARWKALQRQVPERGSVLHLGPGASEISLLGQRFIAASLAVGLPCLLLVVTGSGTLGAGFAAVAALSCVLGQCLEQRLYSAAYARFADSQR
jgi:sulfite dehydrogenase (quinone) subunit SoeC